MRCRERTPDGAKAIEAFRVGDLVLSRSEFDPEGPIEAKVVEELFVRQSLVWELRLGSRLIRTSAEHPFFRNGEWVNANLLRVGDRVLCESGMSVTVEGVRETNDLATVYNFRIADHHTYFVGDWDDGTAVWAHNANYIITDGKQVVRYIGMVWANGHLLTERLAGRIRDGIKKVRAEMPHLTRITGRVIAGTEHLSKAESEAVEAVLIQ